MSYVVSLANTKGGVGKSTLAGNLAGALSCSEISRSVLLIDTDTQASVTKWFDLGEETRFDRAQLTTARVLQQQVPRLRKRYDVIIIDCPPMQSDVTAASLICSDLGLVPVQPSPLDVLAYSELVPLLRQAQALNQSLKLFFVINQLAPRTVLARESEESLADADIPLMPTRIHTRQIYRKVVAEGLSVVDATDKAAKKEMLSLTKDVIHVLEEK